MADDKLLQMKNDLLGWCEEILNSECYKKVTTEYPNINANTILKKIIIDIDEFIKIPDVISLVEGYKKNMKWIGSQKVIGLLTTLDKEISFDEYAPKEVETIQEEKQVLEEIFLELALKKYNDFIVDVVAGSDYITVLRGNGMVEVNRHYYEHYVETWTDIVSVSEGDAHTVGLKKDGSVISTSSRTYGRGIYYGHFVEKWTDIVAVSAGDNYTVGVKMDGTVVAVGDNEYGRCNVQNWSDIVAVSAGIWHTVGLKKDGTVVAVGKNDWGECNVDKWKE